MVGNDGVWLRRVDVIWRTRFRSRRLQEDHGFHLELVGLPLSPLVMLPLSRPLVRPEDLIRILSRCAPVVGWPGIEIPLKDRAHVNQRLMDEFQCQAVYLSEEVADKHYKFIQTASYTLSYIFLC
jgi:hypothetical protein